MTRIAVAQVDGKWPNLALAKVNAYFSRRGGEVEWFNALDCADVIYASKVFTDTPDDLYLPEDAIKGGTGYSLSEKLPEEIEAVRPNWSLWPWWYKDMGFSTRGCVRRCPFCVVPMKEGKLRVVAEFADISTGREELILLDANLTAAPIDHFRAVCDDATAAGVRLNFSQGLDARLLTDEHAAILYATKMPKWIHLAFDSVRDEAAVRRSVKTLFAAGFKPRTRLMYFVLIGYDSTPEDDMYRVELLRDLGVDPFVMRFDRSDPYQTRFSRWVNNPIAFRAMTWEQWNARFKTPLAAEREPA